MSGPFQPLSPHERGGGGDDESYCPHVLIVKAGLGVPSKDATLRVAGGWGGVVWHTCPKGLSSVLEPGKEGVGQHGGSLSNKMQRSPDLLVKTICKGCAWKGRACIVWVLQEAGRGYLGSPARDTCVFCYFRP